jgi:putative transposase
MRRPLQRIYGFGDIHFITFSCFQRRPLLGCCESRTFFANILDEVRVRHGLGLYGYVVMPEHVHVLMGERGSCNPSKAMQVVKQKASARIAGSGSKTPFWQRRFYDFNVWSIEKVKEKLDYMHANPVKRGLVEHPGDWGWSSWSHYAKGGKGLIEIDSVWGVEGM